MGIRGNYMSLKGKQSSELFHVFSELHKIVVVEYEQERSLPSFFSCYVPQHRLYSRYKQDFKISLKPWRVHEVGWLLVIYGLLGWYT